MRIYRQLVSKSFSRKLIDNIWCRMFIQVSQDDIPQVRKVAATVLNDMIKLMPKVPEQELFKIFGQFFKDEQDSVKMQGIDSCVIFCKHLPAQVSQLTEESSTESECVPVALH